MTLIGFAVIVLAGPVVAVVGTLLPFALVGFLVYLVVRAAVLGPVVVGRAVGNAAREFFGFLVAVPAWIGRRIWGGVRLVGYGVRGVASILFPVAVGALIGALLGVIGGIEHNDLDVRVPAGVFIGAIIGAVVRLTRPAPVKEVVREIPILTPAAGQARA